MAEQNLIKKADLARVREVDFTLQFEGGVKKLLEMLGITRKIAKQAGTALKVTRAKGTLQSGIVGEGETIPLSKYETEQETVGELTLKKWRKATSAEAIVEKGYDQAVGMTTKRMLRDVQKGIRADFTNFLSTGTGTAAGSDLQDALAHAWGELQVLFEDDEIEAVYIVNPLDIADYLGAANISTQTAFGMTYVENFLNLGTVVITAGVPKGTIYATAKDNLVLYYVPVNGADLGEAFKFTSDDTGYIGIHEEADYGNMTASDTVVNGMKLWAERIDGVIVGAVGVPFDRLTVTGAPQATVYWGKAVSEIQDDNIAVNGTKITGSLKASDGWASGTLAGPGHFIALKFADLPSGATGAKVGIVPSASGMELQELDADMDAVFKVSDPENQKIRVDVFSATKTTTTLYDLSGLTLE